MNPALLIYIAVGILLFLLGALAALNFLRFRFKGDKTVSLIVIFTVAFFLNVAFTLALLHSERTASVIDDLPLDLIF